MKNKSNNPLVSVIMPTYNSENYIGQAIESILCQTLHDFEFIIVNDASIDKTHSVIQKYMRKDKRIRLVNNDRNLQIAQSLNKGISLAKADFIARMDDDDISLPQRLEKQYIFLQKNKNVAIVGTNILIIDENEKIISKRGYPAKSNDLKKIMFRYSPFAHPTVMFRKKIFQELGGYDPKMVPCEDIDFWFIIGLKYNFGCINEQLLKYRILSAPKSRYDVRETELLGFKIKIKAILKYGYKPSFYDLIFNLLQFLTLWFFPTHIRIKLYNAFRSRNLI